MALHFPLMVNGRQIGEFIAVRREKEIPVDRICTYDVEVTLKNVTKLVVVLHNYDDGPFALIKRALSK